jgi:hypothetical protein
MVLIQYSQPLLQSVEVLVEIILRMVRLVVLVEALETITHSVQQELLGKVSQAATL